MRTTHTYVDLEITPKSFDEINEKLEDALYHHMIGEDGIILEGVRLVRGEPMTRAQIVRRASEAIESFSRAVEDLKARNLLMDEEKEGILDED